MARVGLQLKKKKERNIEMITFIAGPDSSVGIATRYRAGRSGDRIPVGWGEIFDTRPKRP